ncbi:MAG: hypothetical protein ACRDGM_18100 [bacterium]
MVLILTDAATTRVAVPVELQARLTVERGVVKRQYRGVRLADISDIYPFDLIKKRLGSGIQRFIADMAKQEYEVISAEGDFKVTGPYRQRAMTADQNQPKIVGLQDGEDIFEDSADMVVTGMFLARRHRPVMTAQEDN